MARASWSKTEQGSSGSQVAPATIPEPPRSAAATLRSSVLRTAASSVRWAPPVRTPAISSSMEARFVTWVRVTAPTASRSEEHTSELQSLMRISYAVFCLKKKTNIIYNKKVCYVKYKEAHTNTTNQYN